MTAITFRTDPEVDEALVELSEGRDRSTVIREAILTALRQRRSERLRLEATALAGNEADLAEIRAVQADMEHLRAW